MSGKSLTWHRIAKHLTLSADVGNRLITQHEPANTAARLADVLATIIKGGSKILLFGNGGSAADAQHVAAEFVGRYKLGGRRPLPAIALTTDTSVLTAISNDFDYDEIFSRQIYALGNTGDIAVGISCSGASPNVINALRTARSFGLKTAMFTGKGSNLEPFDADYVINVPSTDTALIQQAHITLWHAIVDAVENSLC
jgi:D-sedoheptulose 7-phosphate isomerase